MSIHPTSKQLIIHAARHHLEPDLFNVWIAKHYQGLGRRAGSLALGITEDAYRYRLHKADQIMLNHLAARKDAA